MPLNAWLRPLLPPMLYAGAALLAFRGTPRKVGEVSGHPRFRTVDEQTGQKVFVGIRLESASPSVLLGVADTLAEWVKAAARDAAEAETSGEWDVVHEIELAVGNDAMHMTSADFAQYVYDLRYRELNPRERRIAGPPST